MGEIWKDIKGYEGHYQISNCGNVKNLIYKNQYRTISKEQTIKPHIDKKGYLRVSIGYKPRKTVAVHRLVAMAFIPNLQNYMQVNHIDGNKQNNNVNNLEWCNNDYNMQHAKEHGLLNKRTEKLKKPIIQIGLNNQIIRHWASAKDVEKELGWRSSHIRDCCRGIRKTAYGYKWQELAKNKTMEILGG